MTLKRPTKKLSPYARYKKHPYEYSDQLRNWSADPSHFRAREHDKYLLRLNGWRKLPGEDERFMRFNSDRVEGERNLAMWENGL